MLILKEIYGMIEKLTEIKVENAIRQIERKMENKR